MIQRLNLSFEIHRMHRLFEVFFFNPLCIDLNLLCDCFLTPSLLRTFSLKSQITLT